MKILLYRAILVKCVLGFVGRPRAEFHHYGRTFPSATSEDAMPVR